MSRKSERIGTFAASVGDKPMFVGVDVHKPTGISRRLPLKRLQPIGMTSGM